MANRQKFYESLYGTIPKDFEGRIKLILNTRNAEKIAKKASQIQARVKRIKQHKLEFIYYTEPRPSHRPRVNNQGAFSRIYVPDAAMNKDNFKKFFKEHGNLPFISTPMKFNVTAFAKTPSNFSKLQTLLAEFGIIRPWNRIFDNDNMYKAYTDCVQGTLIEDDSLIYESNIKKYYSIKPRVEYEIVYMDKFPDLD